MTREEKQQTIEELKEEFVDANSFYLTDASTLTVEQINGFRRQCFEKGIRFRVAKNTLIRKALEEIDSERYADLYELLTGPTSIMISEVSNSPAKLLKDFRKNHDRPLLKGAYIDTDVYKGDEQLDALSKLKSKEELIGEIITLLQSPAKNVVSALQSGGDTLSGLVKALADRAE